MRANLPDPDQPVDEREPRKLWFLVRYNWRTRKTDFTRFDQPTPGFCDNLDVDETVHRCDVLLHPKPREGEDILIRGEADELYIENDKLHPDNVTARSLLNRISHCRIFPVLPLKGYALSSHFAERGDKKAVEYVALERRAGALKNETVRQFKITVEELPVCPVEPDNEL